MIGSCFKGSEEGVRYDIYPGDGEVPHGSTAAAATGAAGCWLLVAGFCFLQSRVGRELITCYGLGRTYHTMDLTIYHLSYLNHMSYDTSMYSWCFRYWHSCMVILVSTNLSARSLSRSLSPCLSLSRSLSFSLSLFLSLFLSLSHTHTLSLCLPVW